ncbi:hypothetical protein QU593_00570 [Rossellomorea marisflavi]|uniref:tubby C-terminal domain-like protein n=1 Tax=Rossellomorea marisflavi TaxID=189381 RepID=UPI0025B20F6F|nr:hypothetical protein [Rossellomorea marisflavi]WJV19034.1 hypothetical protein QU593_00570 [Rossellomorea marisflavi]
MLIQLLFYFVMVMVVALFRYLVFDAVDPGLLGAALLFPVGALILYVLTKHIEKKEQAYAPKDVKGWSFYHLQRSFSVPKPLFEGDQKRGYLKRYYDSKRRFIIGEMVSSNWYVSLEIKIDGDLYQVKWYRERRFSMKEHWEIVRNGELIGQAETLANSKGIGKRKEVIEFRFRERTLQTITNPVTSTISVHSGDAAIGTLKRNHTASNVSVMEVGNHDPEALVALILHHFYFK